MEEKQIDQQKDNIKYKELEHIKILLKKNYYNILSSPKPVLMPIISPLFICLILIFFSYVSKNKISHETPEWPVNQFNQNLEYNPDIKFQLGFGIIGNNKEWTDYSMQYLKQMNNYQDKDVAIFYQNDTDLQNDLNQINSYFDQNKNSIQIGVIYCTSEKYIELPTVGKIPLSCVQNEFDFKNKDLQTYLILLNYTETKTSIVQDVQTELTKSKNALSLKLLVDNSLISFSKWKNANPDKIFNKDTQIQDIQPFIQIETQDYPTVAFRIFDGQDPVAQTGAFYFLIPIMLNFLQINQEMVKEKNFQIRQYLHSIGVSQFAYWMSWIITCFVQNIMVSTSICIFGYAFQFNYFTDTPFIILFFMFFSLAFSFNFISFLIVSISENLKVSNTTTYGFMLVSFVLQMLLSNILLVYNLYREESVWWIQLIKYLLSVYPPFNFAKAFGDIGQYSGNHYDAMQNKWIVGQGYSYEQFTNQIHTMFQQAQISAPSTYTSISLMYFDALVFGFIAWYLDCIIFRELPAFFLFQKKYWFPLSFEEELNRSIQQNGIVAYNVTKTYRKNLFNKNGFQALKGISFNVEVGELLTILGHNGAGKSTLISIMTGNINSTSGEIYFNNMEIKNNKEEIRKLIGICPQFDILWPELTAKQHIEIFSSLKFVQNEYNQKLEEVDLSNVADAKVRTFSGGMKRRLSIAVSGIGNPKILFLDEPTTGMDPKSRRKVWALIQKLKKDKSIILTTHAMEEADVLSDRIMVVNQGLMKCIGTSLNLKNTYGDGYKLSLIVDPKNSLSVQRFIKQIIPSSKLLDSKGGSLLFTVPIVSISDLQGFFQLIEINKDEVSLNIKSMIQDWNISNTTLEEVFMKMTQHENDTDQLI